MKFAPVLRLLLERAGLDPGSLGSTAARSAITGRMRACRADDVSSYVARLNAEPAEFQALLDEVIVPETWFFRGGALFYHLAEQIRAAGRPFRALSLPCSTGEEPYSLALALLDAGLPLSRCAIDGVDISSRAVEHARRGVYPELSFRQTDPPLRARHFRAVAGGWQIAEELRQHVTFQIGNILDPALLIFERPYDLVFCRNLFIYLTQPARQQSIHALARLVAVGGLLCLGHADPLDPDDARFSRIGLDGYFLYRRSLMNSPHPGLPAPLIESRSRPRIPIIEPHRTRPPEAKEPLIDLMRRARSQADAGQLSAALELCRSIQTRFGPTADLYSLIGVIQQAREDRPAALQAFRKALYLAPDHREALMHLMLLCQQQGEITQAGLLRKRLERLAGPGEDR